MQALEVSKMRLSCAARIIKADIRRTNGMFLLDFPLFMHLLYLQAFSFLFIYESLNEACGGGILSAKIMYAYFSGGLEN